MSSEQTEEGDPQRLVDELVALVIQYAVPDRIRAIAHLALLAQEDPDAQMALRRLASEDADETVRLAAVKAEIDAFAARPTPDASDPGMGSEMLAEDEAILVESELASERRMRHRSTRRPRNVKRPPFEIAAVGDM